MVPEGPAWSAMAAALNLPHWCAGYFRQRAPLFMKWRLNLDDISHAPCGARGGGPGGCAAIHSSCLALRHQGILHWQTYDTGTGGRALSQPGGGRRTDLRLDYR